jgi:L-ribulose-5-phosphate 3-epimerase
VPGLASAPAGTAPTPYRVSVCDWMILKRQRLGAFALARQIGVEGVQVDMGSLGDRPTFESRLGDPAVRAQFMAAARENGLEIAAIAMSGFYAQSFAERPGYERMVQDAIDTARTLGVRVVFLPLGVRGDLTKRPELRPEIVARLRESGRRAAEAGVVLAVETSLDARAEAAFVDEVGVAAVRLSYNLAHAIERGSDPATDLRLLGRERIAQIHITNTDGVWLENDPKVDLPAVRRALDGLGWRGWLVLERSRDASRVRDIVGNYGANAAFVRRVFE